MGIEQLKIREIVQQAVGKALDIPEFQREFVWDAEQVKKLADSLYRDYPVGSFLLWDSSDYQESKTAEGTQASLWIVDGQQRTTALTLLLGQKPYWWEDAEMWNKALQRYDVLVNVSPDDSADRLEFGLPNPVRRQDPRWVNLRAILATEDVESLTPQAQSITDELTGDSTGAKALFGKVHARLQRLWQIRERDIPIIKVTHEVEDVAEIFARLNQEGTRVKEADVTLALAAVRNPGWVREDYLPFCTDLEERGWDLDAGIFVRTMAAVGHGRARLKEVPKEFWSPNNLPGVWKRTKEVISDVLKRLAERGVFSPDLLPSTNSLIPLFGLHLYWNGKPGYSFGKALAWFLRANWDGRYSGSALTSLNEDIRGLSEAASFDEAIENLDKRLRITLELQAEDFLGRYDRAGNRFPRLMVYLTLFHNQAADWVDKTRLGYDKTGSPVTAGFEPQWHHVYPRKILKDAERGTDDINNLANITVLNERTNVKKLSAKQPAAYVREFGISAEALDTHCVPSSFGDAADSEAALRDSWSLERYDDFLIERAQLLAERANDYMRSLR